MARARERGAGATETTAVKTGPARSDAYTGLLLISLLAQLTAVLFFYLDFSQYPESKPPEPPAISAPAAPGPGGAVGGAAGGAAGGGVK
jgi:hypothetical protein